MFSNISGQQFLLLFAGFVAIYYLIIGIYYRKGTGQAITAYKAPNRVSVTTMPATRTELVGRPVEQPVEEMDMVIEKEEEDPNTIEMLDDDDTILVKEAEKIVEEIQQTINHIASDPPNPEEVFTKINAIVRVYRIFQNTEYFDPVNQFIALAVNRDCHLQWTEPELLALWN